MAIVLQVISIQIVYSESQQNQKLAAQLHETFKKNVNSFSPIQKLKMRQTFQSMFKYRQVKTNQNQKLVIYAENQLFKYLTRNNSALSFFDANQYGLCINSKHESIRKVYLSIKQKIQLQSFTKSQLQKMKKNCNYQFQIPTNKQTYNIHLSNYNKQIKQIFSITNQKLTLITNLSNFTNIFKDVCQFLQENTKSSSSLQTNKMNVVLQSLKLTISNIQKLQLSIRQQTLGNIINQLNKFNFKDIYNQFIILRCFYKTQNFFFAFVQAEGCFEESIYQLSTIFRQKIITKITKSQISLSQIQDLILKPNPSQLRQYLLQEKMNSQITSRQKHILLQYNKLKPLMHQLTTIIQQFIYFKIKIFSQNIHSQILQRLRNMVRYYDALLNKIKKNSFSIQDIGQFCKNYQIIKETLNLYGVQFLFDYQDNLGFYYSNFKQLIKNVWSMTRQQKQQLIKHIKHNHQKNNHQNNNNSNKTNQQIIQNQDYVQINHLRKHTQKLEQLIERIYKLKMELNPLQKLIKQNLFLDIQKQKYIKYSSLLLQMFNNFKRTIVYQEIQNFNKIYKNIQKKQQEINKQFIQLQKKCQEQRRQRQKSKIKHKKALGKVSTIFETQSQSNQKQKQTSQISPTSQIKQQTQSAMISQPYEVIQYPQVERQKQNQGQQITQSIKQIKITYYIPNTNNNQGKEQQQFNIRSNIQYITQSQIADQTAFFNIPQHSQSITQNSQKLIKLKQSTYCNKLISQALKQFYAQNYNNQQNSLQEQLNSIDPGLLETQSEEQRFIVIFYVLLRLIIKKLIYVNSDYNLLLSSCINVQCVFDMKQSLFRLFNQYMVWREQNQSHILQMKQNSKLSYICPEQPEKISQNLIKKVLNQMSLIKKHKIYENKENNQYRLYLSISNCEQF